jgi:hypothetical protein
MITLVLTPTDNSRICGYSQMSDAAVFTVTYASVTKVTARVQNKPVLT